MNAPTRIELVGGKLDGLQFDVPIPHQEISWAGQVYARGPLSNVACYLFAVTAEGPVRLPPIPYRLVKESHERSH